MTLRTFPAGLAGLALVAIAFAPSGAAAEDAAAPVSGATTLGGLELHPANEGSLPLSAVSPPPVMFSLEAPQDRTLPLASGTLSPTLPGTAADDESRTLGTRLSLGQPLGLEALGGEIDWRAAATVEPGPQGDAYGLSLSIGSLTDGGWQPPSDLRMGLTYGTSPSTGEQGVLLDFSYRF